MADRGEIIEEVLRREREGRSTRGASISDLVLRTSPPGPQPTRISTAGETREPRPEELRPPSAVRRVAGGVVRGLSSLPEFALQVMNPLSGYELGISDVPLSSRDIAEVRRRALEQAGLPREAAPGDVLGTAAEEVAAGAGGVGISTLRHGRAVLKATQLALEGGAAAGATVGRLAGQQAQPEGAAAETVGGLAGGLAGGVAARAPSLAARGAGAVARVATRLRGPEAVPREEAIRGARGILEREFPAKERGRALEGIRQAEALEREIPGLRTTLGAATGDPTLMALENHLLSRTDPKSPVGIADVERARIASQSAVERALAAQGPPRRWSGVEVARRRAQESVQNRIQKVESELDAAVAELGADAATYAEARTELLKQDFFDWNEQVRGLSTELDALADQRGVRVPSAPLKRAAARARAAVGSFEVGALGQSEAMLHRIDELGEYMSFGDLRSAQREVNNLFETAQGGQTRVLAELRGGVNEARASLELPTAPPEQMTVEQRKALETLRRGNPDSAVLDDVSRRFREFNEFYAEGAQRYHEGIAKTYLRPSDTVRDATILDAYFQKGVGGKQTAEEYLRVVQAPLPKGATAEQLAQQAERQMDARVDMERWIVAKAAEGAKTATGFDPGRLRKFISDHESALNVFPDAKQKIRSIEALQASVQDLGLTMSRTREAIESGAVGLFISDPHAAMRAVLQRKSVEGIRSLKRLVGSSPEAQEGLKRVFWDVLESRSVLQNPSRTAQFEDILQGRPTMAHGANLRVFVDENEAVIQELLGPNHAAVLRRIAAAAEVVGQFPMPQAAAHAAQPGKSPITTGLRTAGMSRLGSGMVRAARGAESVLDRLKEHYHLASTRVLKEAFLDLPLARVLLEPATPKNMERMNKILTARGVTLPTRAGGRAEEERRKQAAGGVR